MAASDNFGTQISIYNEIKPEVKSKSNINILPLLSFLFKVITSHPFITLLKHIWRYIQLHLMF